MIFLAMVLQLLWIATLSCAGFGIGWLLCMAYDSNMPLFAVIGLGLLYLVLIGYLGGVVTSGIENLTGT